MVRAERGGWPKGNMREEFQPGRADEVAKAALIRASGKVPGPDGFQAGIFKRLPHTYRVLASRFTSVLRSGAFPARLSRGGCWICTYSHSTSLASRRQTRQQSTRSR